MLSKEKTIFVIVCCALVISIPLLWSRSSDFKRNLPRPPTPKWTEQKESVASNPSKSQDVTEKTEVESNPSPKSRLWTKHVHLCIMFNLNNLKPNTHVVHLLLEYYHPFFDHITLIYDGKWNKTPEYIPEYVNFFGCESHAGWYQHKCLNICLSQPAAEVKGFFYISDDMLINLKNLASYNLSQTWCTPTEVYDYNKLLTMDKTEAQKIWEGWGPPSFFQNALKITVDSLPKKWINQLQNNAGFPDHYHGRSIFDIIYVPKSLASNITKVLTHILSSNDLFCELAGPLAVGVVVPQDEKIVFTTSFLWGTQRTVSRIRKSAKTCDVVHSVKLSQPDQASLWKEFMDQQLKIL